MRNDKERIAGTGAPTMTPPDDEAKMSDTEADAEIRAALEANGYQPCAMMPKSDRIIYRAGRERGLEEAAKWVSDAVECGDECAAAIRALK